MSSARFTVALVAFLGIGAVAFADPVDEELIGGDLPIDTRAAGMGGATVSRARGADALYTNPAGLAVSNYSEIAGSGSYRNVGVDSTLDGATRDASTDGLRFGHAGLTYRPYFADALGFGVGIRQVRDFGVHTLVGGREIDGDFNGFEILEDKETNGELYAITFGVGFEVAPGVRIGLATDSWDGGRDRDIDFDAFDTRDLDPSVHTVRYRDSIHRTVSATRFRLGVEVALLPVVTVGGTFTAPSDASIREEWTQSSRVEFDDVTDEDDGARGFTDFDLHLPAEWEGGATFRLGDLRLMGSLRTADWSAAEYSRAPARDVSPAQFARYYERTVDAKLGIEYWYGDLAAVRAGAQIGAIPLNTLDDSRRPVTWTLGATVPVGNDFLLEIAYLRTTWDRAQHGLEESHTTDRIVAGGRILF